MSFAIYLEFVTYCYPKYVFQIFQTIRINFDEKYTDFL